MSHTTTLRRSRTARKAAAAMVIAVAALGLTACQGNDAASSSAPHSSASASAPHSSGIKGKTGSSTNDTSSGTAKKSGMKCTDQINYAGDPRSNAEINSIGEDTGTCPAPEKGSASKGDTSKGIPADPNTKCTNQIDYGNDPRDNATINSIGSDTGYCPAPEKRK